MGCVNDLNNHDTQDLLDDYKNPWSSKSRRRREREMQFMAQQQFVLEMQQQEALNSMMAASFNHMASYLSSPRVGESQAMGKFAEYGSHMTHSNSVDVNHYKTNSPIIDAVQDHHPVSMKTKEFAQDIPSNEALYRYKKDFLEMTGTGNPAKFEKAVDTFYELRNDLPIPAAACDSREAMADYLRQDSILQIPNSHVDSVQDYLANALRQNPGQFGFENASQSNIDQITGRIQPIIGSE